MSRDDGVVCHLLPVLLSSKQLSSDDFDYTLYFVIPAVTGLIMNGLVLALVAFNRKLRSKPYLFLISISAADAVFPLYGALKVMDKRLDMTHNPTQAPNLQALKPACWIASHLEIAVQSTVVLSLVAVSFERFIVICKPLEARDILTRKRCRYFILLIWIMSFAIGFIKPVNATVTCNRFCDEHRQMYQITLCEYTSRLPVAIIRFVTLFTIPFLCMLITYGQVIYALWISSNTQLDLTQASCRRKMHEKRFPRQSTTSSTITTSSSMTSSISGSLRSAFAKSVDECANNNVDVEGSEANNKKLSLTSAVPTSARKQQIVTEITNSRKRLIKMLILVMVIFFVCYGPDVSADIMVTVQMQRYRQAPTLPEINTNDTEFAVELIPNHILMAYNDTQSFVIPQMNFSEPNCHNVPFYNNSFPGNAEDGDEGDEGDLLDKMQQFSRVTMLLHATLNPLLYFIFSKDFQYALLNTLISFKTKIKSVFC